VKYTIPFHLRGKENKLSIDYDAIPNAQVSGFSALKLPFDINDCVGYPMLHAYFEGINLYGYERYCGWIQIIERKEYSSVDAEYPANISYELDISEEMRKHKCPYFAYGYPAEFYDAPCKNLGGCEKLIWRAYTYLVEPPSRMNDNQIRFLAGFSWGYTEDKNETVKLSDFNVLSEKNWLEHKKYALFPEPDTQEESISHPSF